MNTRIATHLLILFCCLTASHFCYASCDAHSHLMQSSKDPFDHYKPIPITLDEYDLLEAFVLSLKGNYQGSYTDIQCVNINEEIIANTQEGSITANFINGLAADLIFSAEFKRKRNSHLESFSYELRKEMLTSSIDDGSIHTVIETISEKELLFHYKLNIRNKIKGYIPFEQTIHILKKQKKVTVIIKSFHFGKLTAQQEWLLKTRKR